MAASPTPVWVLDTNVVISGLLSAHAYPGHLIDMVIARRLRMAFDDRIEGEYRIAMRRPKFNISAERADAFLAILTFQDHVEVTPWKLRAPPDPDDMMFMEVAHATNDRVLVTGNLKHFPSAVRGPVEVLTPKEAWEQLRAM